MCLVAAAIGQSQRFPWVLASNRDEFFDRAAAPLAWWHPAPGASAILAGRDLSAGGTWLGLNAQGRLALVTNVREPGRWLPISPSRGDLVPRWLQGFTDPGALLAVPRNGFNLLAADLTHDSWLQPQADGGVWLSNRADSAQALQAGVYGLSNATLDAPWPKTLKIKRQVQQLVASATSLPALVDGLFAALADRLHAPDEELPTTGVPLERERMLSPIFIHMPAGDAQGRDYGTRSSTVVVVERLGEQRVVHVLERSFDAMGSVTHQVVEQFEPVA